MNTQIFLGSLMLGVCSAIHIFILLYAAQALKRIGGKVAGNSQIVEFGALLSVALLAVVIAHTIQVWAWAVAFVSLGAISDLQDAVYFSLVTYTTLGYGDMTVAAEYRIFAAMAAVTGLLNFGMSTAFLVGLMTRLFPKGD